MLSAMRNRAKYAAAGEASARYRHPGRSSTATGMSLKIARQSFQRWKLARLSAPISQTNRTSGKRWRSQSSCLRRIGSAEPGFEGCNFDTGVARNTPRQGDPLGKRRKLVMLFERIAGRHDPPDLREVEPLHRGLADKPVCAVRGIERAAEKSDPHAVSRGRWPQIRRRNAVRRDHAGRVCPSPRTTYLKVVSCSTPTGPRA